MTALATVSGYSISTLFSGLSMPNIGSVVTMLGLASLWNLAEAINPSFQETLSSLFGNRTIEPETLMELGDDLFHLEAYDRALATYNKAYEQSEDPFLQAEIIRRLGLVYGRLGDQEEALKYLNKALERGKKLFTKESIFFAETSYNRAITLINLGDATTAYHILIDIHEVYLGLSRKAIIEGEYEEALEHLKGAKEALTTPPEYPIGGGIEFGLIEAQRGLCLMQLQNYQEATGVFHEAIKHYSRALETEEHPFIAHLTSMMSLSTLLNRGSDEAAYEGFLRAKALLERLDPQERLTTHWGVDFERFREFLGRIAEGGLAYLQEYRANYEVPQEVTIVDWPSS